MSSTYDTLLAQDCDSELHEGSPLEPGEIVEPGSRHLCSSKTRTSKTKQTDGDLSFAECNKDYKRAIDLMHDFVLVRLEKYAVNQDLEVWKRVRQSPCFQLGDHGAVKLQPELDDRYRDDCKRIERVTTRFGEVSQALAEASFLMSKLAETPVHPKVAIYVVDLLPPDYQAELLMWLRDERWQNRIGPDISKTAPTLAPETSLAVKRSRPDGHPVVYHAKDVPHRGGLGSKGLRISTRVSQLEKTLRRLERHRDHSELSAQVLAMLATMQTGDNNFTKKVISASMLIEDATYPSLSLTKESRPTILLTSVMPPANKLLRGMVLRDISFFLEHIRSEIVLSHNALTGTVEEILAPWFYQVDALSSVCNRILSRTSD